MNDELTAYTDLLLNSWEHTSGATKLPDGYTIDDLHADVAAAVEQTAIKCADIAARNGNRLAARSILDTYGIAEEVKS
jgi:hypothetical protein